MGSDRQLLELAAKGAGYNLYMAWDGFGQFDEYRIGSISGNRWDPLVDDGDALRLMAKLKLQASVEADFQAECTDDNEVACCVEPCQDATDDEALRCLRRAIVRAAAEIGGLMP